MKTLRYIFAAALAVLACAACNKEEISAPAEKAGEYCYLDLDLDFSEPESRVAFERQEGGLKLTWEEGDAVVVRFQRGGQTDSPYFAEKFILVDGAGESSALFMSENPMTFDGTENHFFIGYPYTDIDENGRLTWDWSTQSGKLADLGKVDWFTTITDEVAFNHETHKFSIYYGTRCKLTYIRLKAGLKITGCTASGKASLVLSGPHVRSRFTQKTETESYLNNPADGTVTIPEISVEGGALAEDVYVGFEHYSSSETPEYTFTFTLGGTDYVCKAVRGNMDPGKVVALSRFPSMSVSYLYNNIPDYEKVFPDNGLSCYPGYHTRLIPKSTDGLTHTYSFASDSDLVTVDGDGNVVVYPGTETMNGNMLISRGNITVTRDDGETKVVKLIGALYYQINIGWWLNLGSDMSIKKAAGVTRVGLSYPSTYDFSSGYYAFPYPTPGDVEYVSSDPSIAVWDDFYSNPGFKPVAVGGPVTMSVRFGAVNPVTVVVANLTVTE